MGTSQLGCGVQSSSTVQPSPFGVSQRRQNLKAKGEFGDEVRDDRFSILIEYVLFSPVVQRHSSSLVQFDLELLTLQASTSQLPGLTTRSTRSDSSNYVKLCSRCSNLPSSHICPGSHVIQTDFELILLPVSQIMGHHAWLFLYKECLIFFFFLSEFPAVPG